MTGGSQPLPVVMVARIEGEEFPMIRHFFPFFTKLLVVHFLAFTFPCTFWNIQRIHIDNSTLWTIFIQHPKHYLFHSLFQCICVWHFAASFACFKQHIRILQIYFFVD